MNNRQQTLAWLARESVAYTMVEHPAAATIEDMVHLGVTARGEVCKNLFLRDSRKGARHMLVVTPGHKQVDLQRLGEALGERLSFASEQRLARLLHLKKGEVTPLGVLFDEANEVEVYFDEVLAGNPCVGVHPCDNTATVFLRFEDLYALVEKSGNRVAMLAL